MTHPEPTEVLQDTAAVRRHYSDRTRNRVMKAEDGWHQFRLGLARRRGLNVTMLSMTGYGCRRWVRIFSRVVMAPDSDFENGLRVAQVIADGVRGWRNFVSAPVPFAELTVEVGGREFQVVADRGGIVDAVIETDLEPGWQQVTLRAAGSEATGAEVHIIDDSTRTGVVCDIDDTVVVTTLPRPLLAAWNSFVLDEHARTPTPGMAVMMERLMVNFPGSPVIYISTGAWNVAQTLTRFLTRNLYPQGPLLLTDWGPTADRWFRSGKEHKVQQLERLAQDFPEMSWVLIGDDGQHDPGIYADFVRRHPEHVTAVIIRELTYSEAMLAGGRAEDPVGNDLLNYGDPAEPADAVQVAGERRIPWIYGPDGKDIAAKLAKHGLL
ncbi:App1 family protein [Nesterenkonia lutea]|uniref:Phosphatidate phosphatase APP1 n=1 Tax=Nesterenkonia lutea TaxID=272919 RepID=A0ABR9JAI4_9MICC|nr:phosphatase domain-containing protein [Nesterenkonia lutea]MBE1522938.1 phosphatidate phosphatase APP1 [Nesterenkonia lutea]